MLVPFEPTTYIHESREQADCALKRLADAGRGFGAAADTPSSFVCAQWELWGDGRQLVSGVQRTALVRAQLREQDAIAVSDGAVRAVASFIRDACSAPGLAAACELDGLDASERAVLDVAAGYAAALREAGLVEPGEAAALLRDAVPPQEVVLAAGVWPGAATAGFFQELGWEGYRPCAPYGDALACGVRLRFERPAGPAASFMAVCDLVEELVRSGCRSILVFAPDPLRLFSGLAAHAGACGAACSLDARVPLAQTAFGRALRAVRGIDADAGLAIDHAVDFAYSPWSGMRRADASRLDAALRGDRLADAQAAKAALAEASAAFPLFEGIACGHGPLAEHFEGLAALLADGAVPLRAADIAVEAAALSACEEACAQLAGIGCAPEDPAWLLADVSVAVRKSTADARSADACAIVRDIASMSGAAAGSADAVVVADASEDALGARAVAGPLARLAERIGIPEGPPPAQAARDAFGCALSAARTAFACVVPLRDERAEAVYPSFAVEELLSEALGRTVDAAGIAKAMREADAHARIIGEDDFARAVGRCSVEPSSIVELPAAARGQLRSLDLRRYIRCVQEDGAPVPVLSPSAIEQYAHCPYRWFLERRVSSDALDEGFGAVEKGTFAHEVMAAFYRRGAEAGWPRAEQMPEAAALLDAVFDEVLAEQLAPGMEGRRLAPRSASEMMEVEQLRGQLHRFVELLALLPRDYAPALLEAPIRPEERIGYGGAILNGRIDRLDVDGQGRCAVLDYKGSIKGHGTSEADAASGALPQKMQALIYAQAAIRMGAAQSCTAALYLSYTAQRASDLAAGAADGSLYRAPELLAPASSACDMPHLLDATEDAAAERIAALMAGSIQPAPDHKGACAWCLFTACEVSA